MRIIKLGDAMAANCCSAPCLDVTSDLFRNYASYPSGILILGNLEKSVADVAFFLVEIIAAHCFDN